MEERDFNGEYQIFVGYTMNVVGAHNTWDIELQGKHKRKLSLLGFSSLEQTEFSPRVSTEGAGPKEGPTKIQPSQTPYNFTNVLIDGLRASLGEGHLQTGDGWRKTTLLDKGFEMEHYTKRFRVTW